MLVGPVVEGLSEVKTIPVLLDKIGVRHRPPLRAEGKQDLFRKAVSYAQVQLKKGASHVLFCFDADGPDGPAEEERLKARVRGETGLLDVSCVCVPVHELEAWLLADEEALQKVLQQVIPPVPSPESIPDPARELTELFRRAGQSSGYVKTTHAHRIAKEASDHRLRRCASYGRAVDALLALRAS